MTTYIAANKEYLRRIQIIFMLESAFCELFFSILSEIFIQIGYFF